MKNGSASSATGRNSTISKLSSPVTQVKAVCFGAVRLGKNYVSYYLMPVYMTPALQKRISPELRKRMQGKSCFNFTEIDPILFSRTRRPHPRRLRRVSAS